MNSQRLLCSRKADIKCVYQRFLVYQKYNIGKVLNIKNIATEKKGCCSLLIERKLSIAITYIFLCFNSFFSLTNKIHFNLNLIFLSCHNKDFD